MSRDSQPLPSFQHISAVESVKRGHVHFHKGAISEPLVMGIDFGTQQLFLLGTFQHALNNHLPGNRVHAGLLFLVNAGKKKWQIEIRIFESKEKW